MYKKSICLLFVLLSISIAGPSLAGGSYQPILQASDLIYTSSGGFAQGAALLTRFRNRVRLDINASQLGSYEAHTVWWVVFNNPEYCDSDGCNASDFPSNGGDPRVNASVFWAAGFVADASGMANLSTYVGRKRAWGQVLFGPTLLDPGAAEVHVVLQTHGTVSSSLTAQLTESGAACNPSCAGVQAAIFVPPGE